MLLSKYTPARVLMASIIATLLIGASLAHAHGMTGETHAANKKMKVTVKVKKDKMAGYNLFVSTRSFRWAPEHASGKHVSGEGHGHLMVDGVKVTRLYAGAYYLGNLASGTHKVMVELNGNDHVAYARDGKKIASTATVVVP